MNPRSRSVEVAGVSCRVWEKGDGATVGFLPGLRGLPRWTPFLEALSARHRVVVPSFPGWPGAGPGHRVLDDTADWVAAALDLLEASGLDGEALVGESLGAMLAAEVAALSRATVARLVLISPMGLFDADAPVRNPFAVFQPDVATVLATDAAAYDRVFGVGALQGDALTEHELALFRVDEAAARLFWPFGDRGLAKRLHRIVQPTQVLTGDADALVPPVYGDRFAAAVSGPVERSVIADAGHLASIDRPDEVAAAVARFLADAA